MIDRSNYLPPYSLEPEPQYAKYEKWTQASPEPIITPDYLLILIFGIGIYYLVK